LQTIEGGKHVVEGGLQLIGSGRSVAAFRSCRRSSPVEQEVDDGLDVYDVKLAAVEAEG
jgi:hypothetical protein